ncbi:MAG: N-acetylglucosamine-6-phosphate deacetylase [Geodermatophilaceae bacterium]
MTRLGVGAAVVSWQLVPGDVDVTDGVITDVGLSRAGTGLAVPGFVDLQINGFGGVDFLAADPAGYAAAGEQLLRTGVTAYQPTLITSPLADTQRALAVMRDVIATDVGPRVLGAHLEGPFLSPIRPGTHPVEHMRDPDPALMARLLDGGLVSQVTLAPERPGALELIKQLVRDGVVVACGHTDADAGQAHAAFDAGASTVTHLFNAMRGWSPRHPALMGVALARPDVSVQMIVDGVHLAAETVLVAWRAAAGRAALVTDAMAAAMQGDGRYRLGRVEVAVRGPEVRRPDGTLAGSVLTMDAAVRNLVAIGVPVIDAVAAATSIPAGIARRADIGVLRLGGLADVVVLDDELQVRRVLCRGQECA